MKEHCTNCDAELPSKGKRKKRYCQEPECRKVYRMDLHGDVKPTDDFKWCNRCQTYKPGTQFTIERGSPDGRRSSCKACTYEHLFLYGRGKSTHKIKRSVRAEIGYLRYLAILERDKYTCQLCGEHVTAIYDPCNPPTEAEYYEGTACNIDHIIPRCADGTNKDENLQVTHRKCNGKKWKTPGTTQRPPTTQTRSIEDQKAA
jgi:5-methylcytosine-specific restriction endonuclease McrA